MRSIGLSQRLGCVLLVVSVASCMNQAGLNQNEREAGGGDSGVSVGVGEIAIDPTGSYLLSRTEDRLVYAELATGQTRVLPGLGYTQRVTFDHTGSTLFLTRSTARLAAELEVDEDGVVLDVEGNLVSGELIRYDLRSQRVLWKRSIHFVWQWTENDLEMMPLLDVTDDDRKLVIWYPGRVEVLDAGTGDTLHTLTAEAKSIVDVDLTPDQKRLVITHQHAWETDLPNTPIELLDLETFARVQIDVPNCSSELVISADGKYAFLAPSRCQKDPVSVIDLESERFVRNLPGFGPVALAADGALAVAFMDAANLDATLFDDPEQMPTSDEGRYHLMLIDTTTLRFEVIALGDQLPRFALAPDGKLLLVDSPDLWQDGRIRLLDVAKKELAPVSGPSLQLNHYAMTRDSSKVYLLDDGLYAIALAERRAEVEPIDFTPTHLNITPDDALLVLREDDHRLWLYGTQDGALLRSIDLAAAPR